MATRKASSTSQGDKSGSEDASRSQVVSAASTTEPGKLAASVSPEVLARTPERALKLLRGISSRERVASALAERGYSAEDHQRGWELIHPLVAAPAFQGTTGTPQGAALVELDRWDEPNLEVIRTSLAGDLSAVRDFLLDGISPTSGPAVVVSIGRLVTRVAELQPPSAAARAAGVTDALAQDALEKLTRRGYPEAEWKRLAGLVELARTVPVTQPRDLAAEVEHHNRLVRLREWFEEIAALARRSLTRRDDLIFLGLAGRRSAREEKPAVDDAKQPPDALEAEEPKR